MMKPHKKLIIWEKIMVFVERIYKSTGNFPKEEVYGMVSQMRRSAVSIASNIAEGCGRKSNQEKIHFFVIARGSLSEIDAQLEIAVRLGFLDKEGYETIDLQLTQISLMLQGLINSREKAGA